MPLPPVVAFNSVSASCPTVVGSGCAVLAEPTGSGGEGGVCSVEVRAGREVVPDGDWSNGPVVGGRPVLPIMEGLPVSGERVQLLEAVEEATAEKDVTGMWAELGDGAHDWPTQLSDDWLPCASVGGLMVVRFGPKDLPRARMGDEELNDKLDQLKLALLHLKALGRGEVPEECARDPVAFLESVKAKLPDPQLFQAGGWARAAPVWRVLLSEFGAGRKNAKWLLSAITEGVKWELVAPITQKSMPDHAAKMSRALGLLTTLEGADKAAQRLRSATLDPVQFPNHASTAAYPEFVTETVEKYVRQGVVMQLPAGQRPVCVNPLGVHLKRGKLRLITDPLLTNLVLRYLPLRYEQLKDVSQYVQAGDWGSTTDEKSGYHHLPLHPDMWSYVGFFWEGRYYVFTHLPFGVGPACWAYTTAKQELYRVVRELGKVKMSFFIDDQLNVADTWLKAVLQHATIIRLKAALGFTLSVDKLQDPSQRLLFLGFVVDLLRCCFELPPEKIAEFQELVRDCVTEGHVTSKRSLAVLAGKLVSFSPAVGLAPLYAQALFKI